MTIDEFLATECTIWGDKNTWRDWFQDLLITLLVDGEGFSGKRPNCDSCWQTRLAEVMCVVNPLVVTAWEEEEMYKGCTLRSAYSVDWKLYNQLCKEIMEHLFKN